MIVCILICDWVILSKTVNAESKRRMIIMKKKTITIFLMVCLIMAFNVSGVFAEEEVSETENEVVTRAVPQATSRTVTDKYGNKYKVSGLSSISGKRANVQTEFKVTYYKAGKKDPVNAYTKTLTGTGRVWFHGAASDNQFTKNKSMTGARGTYTAYDSYDFLIKSLHSTHKFYCQGASTSFYTQM